MPKQIASAPADQLPEALVSARHALELNENSREAIIFAIKQLEERCKLEEKKQAKSADNNPDSSAAPTQNKPAKKPGEPAKKPGESAKKPGESTGKKRAVPARGGAVKGPSSHSAEQDDNHGGNLG